MKLKAVSGIMLMLLLTGMLASLTLFSFDLGVSAQSEKGVPYVPLASQVELNHWKENGTSYINISIEFPSSEYNVSDWGTPTLVGNSISANAEIWNWTGPDATVLMYKNYTYNLGKLPAGEYLFTFKAWGSDVKSISFTSAPDLCVEAIMLPYFGPVPLFYPNPNPGFFYKIRVNVTNQGTADAGSFNVSLSAYLNETLEWWRNETIAGLEQGATKTVSFDFNPPKYGNYTITVMADCDSNVAESNETNNVKTAWMKGTIRGDTDGDSDVGFDDFAIFTKDFIDNHNGILFTDPPYPTSDLDYDSDIDLDDFFSFAGKYGQSI